MVATLSNPASNLGSTPREDVVEILLLLGASRLDALANLAQCRGQSVGQLVRSLIERELKIELASA